MEIINITKEHQDFVKQYAPNQDIGGFSNLSSSDLNKSSRLGFQYTGIFGELAWYLYRYASLDKLQKLLEYKFAELRPTNTGDGGFDDVVTHNNFTRLIDIKSSHTTLEKIPSLNLIVPEREYHQKMIYVAAFTLGSTRQDVSQVVLAGWCANEHISQRWFYDPNKYCMPVSKLKNLSSLKKIL
jgi:hypothetical protein